MLRFYGLRILRDYLGHIILIGLPVALITINTYLSVQNGAVQEEIALFIGLIYIFMFQVFGAAYTFEGMEHDFYSPFKDRLRAAPVKPFYFILANLFYSTLTSLLQSLFILSYVVIVFGVRVSNWGWMILVFVVAVLLAQLLAGVLIVLLKKASKAQAVITLYAILSPMLAGFFFTLPSGRFKPILEQYSSPVAWAWTSVHAFMDSDFQKAFYFLALLVALTVVLALVLAQLSKRVVR